MAVDESSKPSRLFQSRPGPLPSTSPNQPRNIRPTLPNCISRVVKNHRTTSLMSKLRIVACNSNILMLDNTLALTGFATDAVDDLADAEDDDR